MKAIFETDKEDEIKRLAKVDNMASFIWELKHNGWRELADAGYDFEPAWAKINELLDKHYIDIDELWG